MMENIYEQIDKMLHSDESKPAWADEILQELKEIKALLKNKPQKAKRDREYFKFVNKLRERMRADMNSGKYPEIYFQGKTLGVNFKGHIYDKADTKALPAHEAFKVYRFLYQNQDRLDKYINF